jgi:hypothetical protein
VRPGLPEHDVASLSTSTDDQHVRATRPDHIAETQSEFGQQA